MSTQKPRQLRRRLLCQTVDVDEMACAELVERVTDYLEGVLDPQTILRLNDHLAACESCESFIAQVKTAMRVAGSLPEEEITEDAESRLVDIYQRWLDERDEA